MCACVCTCVGVCVLIKDYTISNYDDEAGDDDMACQRYLKSLQENTRYRINDIKLKKWDMPP